jgi:hypothetical protein
MFVNSQSIKKLIMCELTPIPYSVFLLPKKDTSRKKELLDQPKIIKGTNNKFQLKNI